MKVNGFVKISLSLNVYDLETDAVYIDRYGNVKISDDDQFFVDWSDLWETGTGELMGASTISCELEAEPEDDEDDDDEDSEEEEGR